LPFRYYNITIGGATIIEGGGGSPPSKWMIQNHVTTRGQGLGMSGQN
jgi:hypothetical protein